MKRLIHCLPGGYERCVVDPTQEGLAGWNAELTTEDNDSGELEFVISSENPEFNAISTMRSELIVMDGEVELWRGRVTDQDSDKLWEKKIICKGILDYLYDGIIWPQSFEGTAQNVLTALIEQFNASTVEAHKHFAVGNVRGIKDVKYELKQPQKAWKVISNLIKEYGGSVSYRRDGDINYIDWLAADRLYRPICTQRVIYGENLLSLSDTVSGEDLATVIYGFGKNQITAAAVNDGKSYVVDVDAAKEFGYIEDAITLSDIVDESALLAAMTEELGTRISQVKSIEATAVDLSDVDPTQERIDTGMYVRLISAPHDIDEIVLVGKICRPLFSPQKTKITLGASFQAASKIMRRSL